MLTPRKLDGIMGKTNNPGRDNTLEATTPEVTAPPKELTDPFITAKERTPDETTSQVKPEPETIPNGIKEQESAKIEPAPSETIKLKGLDKKFDKDIFFLKQSYRSLYGLLFLIFSGLMFSMFSETFANLMISSDDLAKGPEFLKGDTIPKILMVCGVLLMLVGIFKVMIARLSSKYEIQRLCIKTHKGIIAKRRATIQYADVRAAQTNKSVIGAILNFGDIEFFTAGSDGSEIILKGVYSPDRVAEQIDIRINKAKQAIKEGSSTISV